MEQPSKCAMQGGRGGEPPPPLNRECLPYLYGPTFQMCDSRGWGGGASPGLILNAM